MNKSRYVMTSILKLRKRRQTPPFSRPKCDVKVILIPCDKQNQKFVILYLEENLLRRSDKMLGKPLILSFFLNLFNNFNKI